MNRSTNAAKYAAIIMSLIVTVTMVSGCKKNNTDVSSELNKSDIEETSQDMTGSGIEDSDAGSQSAEETAETESTEQTESDFEENTEQIETDAGQEETQNPYIREKEPYTGVPVYESEVTLKMAEILRDKLLLEGYDVLMIRDSSDVQLDNVARTVICNNVADCHISLHWDGDGLSYDKGCFYIAVPDAIKNMSPVADHWQQHDSLGASLVDGLRGQGAKIHGSGSMTIDLTQTSYSTVPSVDMELGNASSDHSDETLEMLANGIVNGVSTFFGY